MSCLIRQSAPPTTNDRRPQSHFSPQSSNLPTNPHTHPQPPAHLVSRIPFSRRRVPRHLAACAPSRPNCFQGLTTPPSRSPLSFLWDIAAPAFGRAGGPLKPGVGLSGVAMLPMPQLRNKRASLLAWWPSFRCPRFTSALWTLTWDPFPGIRTPVRPR